MTFPPELVPSAAIAAFVAAACLVLSWLTRESSWTDRIWSVVPPIYVGTFAVLAHGADLRLDVMTLLTAAWGARLTFNFARKGGYAKGGEDYRWAILRARMPGWAYELFNVGFIAGYQNLLLWLIALPAWAAYRSAAPFGPVDAVLTVLFVALLVGEFVADQQQWDFHQAKKARQARGEPVGNGFCDTGLWAWSRHPNFFCELGQWWVVYAFSVAAGAGALNVTLAGPVLLTLLFHGSADFTESLTAAKYPAYAEYQRRVGRIVPRPWARAQPVTA